MNTVIEIRLFKDNTPTHQSDEDGWSYLPTYLLLDMYTIHYLLTTSQKLRDSFHYFWEDWCRSRCTT